MQHFRVKMVCTFTQTHNEVVVLDVHCKRAKEMRCVCVCVWVDMWRTTYAHHHQQQSQRFGAFRLKVSSIFRYIQHTLRFRLSFPSIVSTSFSHMWNSWTSFWWCFVFSILLRHYFSLVRAVALFYPLNNIHTHTHIYRYIKMLMNK